MTTTLRLICRGTQAPLGPQSSRVLLALKASPALLALLVLRAMLAL
jgi:hypothetical protein